MSKDFKTLGRALSDVTIQLHESIAAAAGLSGTEHKSLYFIAEHGPVTAGEIAVRTRLTTGAITGLVDRLEARGLVKRIFDKADRRKVLIQADSEKVAELLSPLSLKVEQCVSTVLSHYTSEEQQLIGRYMEDVVSALQTLKTT